MTDRKKDHIEMAFSSRTDKMEADRRFFYEPLLAAHHDGKFESFHFAGGKMRLPIWVSSMTGGTNLAGTINRNLAMACAEFGMGLGLGSCRTLLKSDDHFSDFDVRPYLGEEVPLYANIGISQLETLMKKRQEKKIDDLVKRLNANGIIIHVNPLQEAFQPEGDHFKAPPIETIEAFLFQTNLRVIVKEVGQGMGPASLARLLSLPLEAVEFGALGGTNFTKVELTRQNKGQPSHLDHFGNIGHTAAEMTNFVNDIVNISPVNCQQIIISGGITNVPDGYYLTQKSKLKSIFGMGSAFLKHAMGKYHELRSFMLQIQSAIGIAQQYLITDKQDNNL
jgi:isopentenyl-diphosphate delta-isomerase